MSEVNDSIQNNRTYRNGHQLFDVLDLVAGGGHAKAFEFGSDLGHGEQALLRGLRCRRRGIAATQDNLIIVSVVLVKECLLVLNGARCDLHLQGVLLCILFNFLQVLVVTVLCQPANNVTV